MLQYIAPERLGNKKGPNLDTWISLGKVNRRNSLGKLGACRDGNRRDEVWVAKRDSTKKDNWKTRVAGQHFGMR